MQKTAIMVSTVLICLFFASIQVFYLHSSCSLRKQFGSIETWAEKFLEIT